MLWRATEAKRKRDGETLKRRQNCFVPAALWTASISMTGSELLVDQISIRPSRFVEIRAFPRHILFIRLSHSFSLRMSAFNLHRARFPHLKWTKQTQTIRKCTTMHRKRVRSPPLRRIMQLQISATVAGSIHNSGRYLQLQREKQWRRATAHCSLMD